MSRHVGSIRASAFVQWMRQNQDIYIYIHESENKSQSWANLLEHACAIQLSKQSRGRNHIHIFLRCPWASINNANNRNYRGLLRLIDTKFVLPTRRPVPNAYPAFIRTLQANKKFDLANTCFSVNLQENDIFSWAYRTRVKACFVWNFEVAVLLQQGFPIEVAMKCAVAAFEDADRKRLYGRRFKIT